MNTKRIITHHCHDNESSHHNVINTLSQEVDFWKHETQQANHSSYIAAAKEVYSLFQNASSVFRILQKCSFVNDNGNKDADDGSLSFRTSSQIFDFLEKNFTDGNVIDSMLYNIFQVKSGNDIFIYSASRMRKTIDMITNSVCRLLRLAFPHQSQFHETDVQNITALVIRSKDIIKSYSTMINRLTKIDFALRNYDPWPQSTSGYCNENMVEFINRMDNLHFMFAICSELELILPHDDFDSLNPWDVLKNFDNFDPLDVFSDESKMKLKDCLSRLDESLVLYDSVIARKIEEEVQNIKKTPFLILSTVEKFLHTLKRKGVQRNLPLFQMRLKDIVQELLKPLECVIEDGFFDEIDQVQSIFKCRQTKRKVEKIIKGYSFVIDQDDELLKHSSELSKMCDSIEKSLFETWLDETKMYLRESLVALESMTSLIESDVQNGYKVVFHNDLARLIDQDRKLQLLSFNTKVLSRDISIAKKYYKLGSFLNRIVAFRNHVERYSRSEEKDLIKPVLVEFDNFIMNSNPNQNVSSWKNEVEWQRFASDLFSIANKLRNEMDRIKALYEGLTEKACSLFNYDLFSQKSTWLQSMKDIEVHLGSKVSNLQSDWVTCWTNQIFKVCEASYVYGLARFIEVPPIRIMCEMTLKKDNHVAITPSLNELRSTIYSQIQNYALFFKAIVSIFQGRKLFDSIPTLKEAEIAVTYVTCEIYLCGLGDLLEQYSNDIMPSFEVTSYAEKFCLKAEDYEKARQYLRRQKQKVEEWPEIESLSSYFKVSTSKLSNAAIDRLEFYEHCLDEHLHIRTINEFNTIQNYITSTKLFLSDAPREIQDMKEKESALKTFKKKLPMIQDLTISCERKISLILLSQESAHFASKKKELKLMKSTLWSTFNKEFYSYGELLDRSKTEARHETHEKIKIHEQEIAHMKNHWDTFCNGENESKSNDTMISMIDQIRKEIDNLVEKDKDIKEHCAYLGIQIVDYSSIDLLYNDIKRQVDHCKMITDFDRCRASLGEAKFNKLQHEQLEDFVSSWKSRICGLRASIAPEKMLKSLSVLESIISILKNCNVEIYKDEHWAELYYEIFDLPSHLLLHEVSLNKVLDTCHEKLLMRTTLSSLKDLTSRAMEEVAIKESLDEVISWFKSTTLICCTHDCSERSVPLIKDSVHQLSAISNQLDILASLKDSACYKSISELSSIYENNLVLLNEVLSKLLEVQTNWLHLQRVFSSGALKSHQKDFDEIDHTFRKIMIKNENVMVKYLIDQDRNPEMGTVLDKLLKNIEKCQRNLLAFIEAKRDAFPRLNFVGDESVVELMGSTQSPINIQPFLRHLFQGIHTVVFDEYTTNIIAIRSIHGEEVKLCKIIGLDDSFVEDWLVQLCEQQTNTLKESLSRCLNVNSWSQYNAEFPSQIHCLAERIRFTNRVEAILDNHNETLIKFREELFDKIQDQAENTSTNLSNLELCKQRALILQIIHQRDIIDLLIKSSCGQKLSWTWYSQMRHTFIDQTCYISVGDAKFEYSFEYQGNAETLVNTELTEKCYFNLTQAMMFGFGGNPFGPAGTGKTETVKSLGSLLGRQVLVFNCDEGLNYQTMGRIFVGLVRSGAWGCFDEINRLKEEELSVIADLIQSIQRAMKNNQKYLLMFEKTICVNNFTSIFVTLNPSGKGYEGRSELPSNLKALFRQIAMGLPDKYKIVEVSLLSDGFKHAKILSRKLIQVFLSAEKSLPRRRQYDWGLRAIKTVVRTAGKLRTSFPQEQCLNVEKNIVGSSIEASVVMSLETEDVETFKDLIKNAFGDLEDIRIHHDVVQVRDYLLSEGKHSKNFMDKIIQLMQAINQRSGCIILGDVGSGKSYLWKELHRVMQKIGISIRYYSLNPKAFRPYQIIGKVDEDTGDWNDGVLTSLIRKSLAEGGRTWLVCDGEINPEWIESLNSVLDDNRLLTLPTGERLSLSADLKFIFETRDLSYTSPATISRNALICMNNEQSNIDPHIAYDDVEQFEQWIDNSQNFIIVGTDPTYKIVILQKLLTQREQIHVKIIDCFENMCPEDLIRVFEEACTLSTSRDGKVYRPSSTQRLVLILNNIENLKCDKYGTCALFSFIHHLYDYGGFYTSDCSFVYVKGVQTVFVSNSIDMFTKTSTVAIEQFKKKMPIGLIRNPSKQVLVDLTSLELIETSKAQGLSIQNKDWDRISHFFVNFLEEIIDTMSSKGSDHIIPYHILCHFVQNLMKYEDLENEVIREKCCAFEALRCAENFLAVQETAIPKKILEKYRLHSLSDIFLFSNSSFNLVGKVEVQQKLTACTNFAHLHFCDEVLQTLSAIQHVMLHGSKSISLYGSQGSGRKTLLKLACEINSIEYISPNVVEEWDVVKLRNQLQQLFFRSGVEQERICFHVEDFMLCESGMINLMNRVVRMGESMLSCIFDSKELRHCVQSLQGVVSTEKEFYEGKRKLLSNVNKNLSIFFSKTLPLGLYDHFSRDTAKVYVREWRRESVHKLICLKCDKVLQKTPRKDDGLCSAILQIYMFARNEFGASQGDLLGFLDVWLRLFKYHFDNNVHEIAKLELGLEKMNVINTDVGLLHKESEQVKKEVIKAQEGADRAMSDITEEMANSKLRANDINELKVIIAKKSEECKENKGKIELEIGKIRPMLEASEQAIRGIKRQHLNEIKSFKTPPQAICDVLSAVLMLKGTKDLSWNSMKAFLSKRGMIDEIINFDVNVVPPQTVTKVMALVQKKEKSFEKSVISRVSVAAAPLASWVTTNLEHLNIIKSIQPLETQLSEMNRNLEDCEKTLKEYENSVKELDERVIQLKSDFATKTKEAGMLKQRLLVARRRSDTATRLIEQLSDEQLRWEQSLDNLKEFQDNLWAHLLLQSTYSVYLSDKTEDERNEFKILCLKILSSIQRFDLLEIFQMEQELWKYWGLGQDSLSKENAAIIASGLDKPPYLIDPNGIATSWLTNYASNLSSKPLEIVLAGDAKFCLKVELCVKTGKVLVVKNIEGIKPCMYPLVKKEIVCVNSRNLVKLGMKRIPIHNDFQLFFLSKMTNISVVESRIVRVIAYGVTSCGIEERLLSTIVRHEMPKLEHDLQLLIKKESNHTADLVSQESRLLTILCEANGDLLENDSLVEILIETREKATQLSKYLVEIADARSKISEQCKEYQQVANLSMSLFSTLSSLEIIDHFYRFSLEQFELVFHLALKTFDEFKHNGDLGSHIIRTIALTFVSSISKSDRIVYYYHIIDSLKSNCWRKNNWDLLTGCLMDMENLNSMHENNEGPQWLTKDMQKPFNTLKKYCPEVIPPNLDSERWKSWSQSDDCFSNFPFKSSSEDRLLFVKMLRPDNFPTAIMKYCCDQLGVETLSPISKTLAQHFDRNIKVSSLPILIITMDSNDPENEIRNLAESSKCGFSCISLGGRCHNVQELLRSASSKGEWICLKNLHLALDLINHLEQEIEELLAQNNNSNFKVWLTTEKNDSIPSSLITRSFKITYETPGGLRENVKSTFARWEDLSLDLKGTKMSNQKIQMFFILAWIHAIVNERGSLKPLGWKQNYEFGHGDLKAAELVFDTYWNSPDATEIIRYFLTSFIYGGKVNDTNDEIVLKNYIEHYFCDDVLVGARDLLPGLRFHRVWDDQSYGRAVRSIPELDSPTDFGLPSNSFRSLNNKNAVLITEKLKQLKSHSDQANKTNSERINEIDTIINQWKNLLQGLSSLIDKSFHLKKEDDVLKFLESEIQNGQRICRTVVSSIELLENVSSKKVEENFLSYQKLRSSLMIMSVPDAWERLWSGPLNVHRWMTQVVKKMEAINTILETDKPFSNTSINLSILFRVEAFLNMMKLKFCKENNHSMEDVSVFSTFESKSYIEKSHENFSITIEALFLRGCLLEERIDGTFIVQPVIESSPEFVMSPTIRLTFATSEEFHLSQSEVISIPVYSNICCEEALFHVTVNCEKGSSRKWILAGPSLFLECGS